MKSSIDKIIGMEFETYTFKVEHGKIKEFARAIGDDNLIYQDLEFAKNNGYEGIPIPPTFLTAVDCFGGLNFEEKVNILQLNFVNVLHGQQEYAYLKDIYVDDVLTVTSKITGAELKKGSTGLMDIITTENSYINQSDELAALSKEVIIHRH
ncbi:FAS1-like dehydratase domain-containing protein [Oceanobacillus sp. CF4.6]|uniref:FAS1-like dehydratase domain-containing protein n=1 Tax=Oceanobacillus sp. CF4.6 TaxID=3373080 RepID=UPI003EE42DF7